MARKKARMVKVDNKTVTEVAKPTRRGYVERDHGLDCSDYLPDRSWPGGGCSKSYTCAWVLDMLHLSGHGNVCCGKRKGDG